MKQHNYYIYILTTTNNKIIYVGMTNDLQRRLYEHQNNLIDGFTKRYNLTKLVYYENTNDVNSALQREKEIKKWRREKKNNLVKTTNPDWNDLSDLVFQKISQSTDEVGLLRNDINSITGIIIAAGLSSRMGTFKPLLQYESKSFIENIIIKMSSICDNIIVVTGHNKDSIETELISFQNRCNIQTVFNKNYNVGMFSSLQKGLEKLEKNNWVLYHFVDQPSIPRLFYEQIFSEIDDDFDWIQPINNGKKGHPILLSGKSIKTILSSDSKSNLKQISERNEIRKKYFETDTKTIFFDVDTKIDYKKLIEQH